MMTDSVGALLYFCGVLCAVTGQLLLKTAASRSYQHIWSEYLNRYVAGGYALLLASSLLTVFAYRNVPLSLSPFLSASSYLFIGLFSVLLFHERWSPKKRLGYLLIFAGICLAMYRL